MRFIFWIQALCTLMLLLICYFLHGTIEDTYKELNKRIHAIEVRIPGLPHEYIREQDR